MVRLLLEQPTVDAGALDSTGRSPLDDVEAMLERTGDVGFEARLQTVQKVLLEADLTKQMQRQKQDGVTLEEVILTSHPIRSPPTNNLTNLLFQDYKLSSTLTLNLTVGPAGA